MKLDFALFTDWRRGRDDVPEIVTESNQYVFASLNVEDCKDVFKPTSELAHIDDALLAKIYLFDRIIRNTDRTDYNSNLLVNGRVYIIDHNNAFAPAFSEEAFSGEHILRDYRDLISDEEKVAFVRYATELCGGAFIDEVWSEMPEEWTDAGSIVLPLSSIRKSFEESTHGGNVL